MLSLIKLSWFEAAIKEVWRILSHINIMLARTKGSVTASSWALFMRQGVGSLPSDLLHFFMTFSPFSGWPGLGPCSGPALYQGRWYLAPMCDETGSSHRSSSCGCRPAGDEGGMSLSCRGETRAPSPLPAVEPNCYLSHKVAATPELILETVFCEMPLKCKTQCLLPASAALLISHHEGSWQMDLPTSIHWTLSLKPILESIIT